MVLTLSNLQTIRRHQPKRLGRGHGSGRGTYAGRGLKGQRARTGGRKNLKRRGLKQMLMQLPKNRGFRSYAAKTTVVNTGDLEKKFEDNSLIDLEKLKKSGLIRPEAGRVKILNNGRLAKKFEVKAHAFSKSAENAIIKAGGKISVIIKTKPKKSENKKDSQPTDKN